MTSGALVLAVLALAAPAARPPPPLACTRYRAQVEKNALVDEAQLAAWTAAALERARRLDPQSPCIVHVRVTAAPIRSGGREDGWMAHVGISTRRYLKEGKLVTHEKGMLLVEATREALAQRARAFVEEFVSRLGAANPGPPGGDPGPG